MFSLIITVISILLVSAIMVATLYYGGSVYTTSKEKALAIQIDNQASQIWAATQMYFMNNQKYPASPEALVAEKYLSVLPSVHLSFSRNSSVAYAEGTTSWSYLTTGTTVVGLTATTTVPVEFYAAGNLQSGSKVQIVSPALNKGQEIGPERVAFWIAAGQCNFAECRSAVANYDAQHGTSFATTMNGFITPAFATAQHQVLAHSIPATYELIYRPGFAGTGVLKATEDIATVAEDYCLHRVHGSYLGFTGVNAKGSPMPRAVCLINGTQYTLGLDSDVGHSWVSHDPRYGAWTPQNDFGLCTTPDCPLNESGLTPVAYDPGDLKGLLDIYQQLAASKTNAFYESASDLCDIPRNQLPTVPNNPPAESAALALTVKAKALGEKLKSEAGFMGMLTLNGKKNDICNSIKNANGLGLLT